MSQLEWLAAALVLINVALVAMRKVWNYPLPVGWMPGRDRWRWGAAVAAAWVLWSSAMHRYTDAAAPWIDGGIAMLSIAAQWLLARRRVESWWLWILVDLIAVPLFAWRGLYATSAVYIVLLGLSIDGLIQWRRAAAAPAAMPA